MAARMPATTANNQTTIILGRNLRDGIIPSKLIYEDENGEEIIDKAKDWGVV